MSQVFPVKSGSPFLNTQIPRGQYKLSFGIPVVADTAHGLNGEGDSLGLIMMVHSTGTMYKRDTVPTGGHFWNPLGVGSGGATWGGITGTISAQSDLQTALAAKQNSLGFVPIAPTDTATMLANYLKLAIAQGLFYPLSTNPAGYLNSNGLPNVSNFLQVINAGGFVSLQRGAFASMPAAGIPGRGFIGTDSLFLYVDNGSAWIKVGGSGNGGGGSSVWGGITGTLSSQTDLNNALNLKENYTDTATMLGAYLRKSLLSAKIWAGNGSNVPTQVSPGKDVTMDNAGNFTVVGVQGKAFSLGVGALAYNGTSVAFNNNYPNTVGAINGQSKSSNGLVLNAGNVYSQTVDGSFPGLQVPADKLFEDSLHNFPDSIRLFLGHDSLYLGLKYANQSEISKFQFRIDTLTTYSFVSSIVQSGTNVQLVGDQSTPAANQYYGTNISGVRSFYNLPSNSTNLGSSATPSVVTITSSSGAPANIGVPDATHAGIFPSQYKLRADSIHYQMNATAVSGADSLAYRRPNNLTDGDTTVLKRIIFRNGTNTTVTDNSTQDLIDITINSTGGGGGGSGNTNSNVGTQFRLAFPNTNNIRTIGALYGFKIDSATFSNALAMGPDTSLMMTTATTQTVTGIKNWYGVQSYYGNIFAPNLGYAASALSPKLDAVVTDTSTGQEYRRAAQFVDMTGAVDGSLVQWSASAQNFIMGSRTSGFGDPGANGFMSRTAINVSSGRTFQIGTVGNLTITNPDGVSGNPVFDIGTHVVTTDGSQTLTNKNIATSEISGVFGPTNGGVNSSFFQVSGPASTVKTFFFPNISANVLTDANTLTTLQGGTGNNGTLSGYLKANLTGAYAAVPAIPVTDVTGAAPSANSTFTGTMVIPTGATVVTQPVGSNDLHPASDAFVTTAVGAANIYDGVVNNYTAAHTLLSTEGTAIMISGTGAFTLPSASSNFGKVFRLKNMTGAAIAVTGMGPGENSFLAAFGSPGDAMTVQAVDGGGGIGDQWRQFAASTSVLASGTYTPTINNIQFATITSIGPAFFQRIGATVFVRGSFIATVPPIGDVMIVSIVPPFPSNFSTGLEYTGEGTSIIDFDNIGNINTINSSGAALAKLQMQAAINNTGSAGVYNYSYSYTIH